MKKVSGRFQRVSWDQALGEVSEKLKFLRSQGQPHTLALFEGLNTISDEDIIRRFADSYGIVRTEMSKVMAQLAGESNLPNLELDDKTMEILKKWLND